MAANLATSAAFREERKEAILLLVLPPLPDSGAAFAWDLLWRDEKEGKEAAGWRRKGDEELRPGETRALRSPRWILQAIACLAESTERGQKAKWKGDGGRRRRFRAVARAVVEEGEECSGSGRALNPARPGLVCTVPWRTEPGRTGVDQICLWVELGRNGLARYLPYYAFNRIGPGLDLGTDPDWAHSTSRGQSKH